MTEEADWRPTYSANSLRYDQLKTEVLFMLGRAITDAGIKVHSITARVKTEESLADKALRKGYTDPLSEAGDVVGARVVVLFLSDLPRVESVCSDLFEIVSTEDMVETGDPSSFGYMSRHHEARIRAEHTGPRYDTIRDLRFELQVRTLLMDAWANVSHYLAYKGESSIPTELRRDFYALSGLFYVADKHFELFFDRAEGVEAEAEREIQESRTDSPPAELNLESFLAYLRARYPERERGSREGASEVVNELLIAGYGTIAQLEAMLDEGAPALAKEEREINQDRGDGSPFFQDIGAVRVSLEAVDPDYVRPHRESHESHDPDEVSQENEEPEP